MYGGGEYLARGKCSFFVLKNSSFFSGLSENHHISEINIAFQRVV